MRKMVSCILPWLIVLTLLSCEMDTTVELIPGERIGPDYTYYQEYEASLGSKSIEGIIDIAALSPKVDTEGAPYASFTIDPMIQSYDESSNEWVENRVEEWPADSVQIAVNIDTGYYKVTGLPSIENGQYMKIVIGDMFWTGPSHERYRIVQRYDSTEWNGSTAPFEMPTASFLTADSTINVTTKFIYMVDAYWLENNEYEVDGVQDFNAMSYSELSGIANMSVADWESGAGYSWGSRTEYGVSYGVHTHITMDDVEAQKVTYGGFHGGIYTQVSASIIANGAVYGGYIDYAPGVILGPGNTHTSTVNIYIPAED
ncbi:MULTISPECIES: hypothetical protein [unclassified Oceanispirochaeta]|uniref:hypothetical protein n=1 Tax=unclassified Oceanispirochaeta TaxID=2635722 RepID=UPI000E091995|nr:MULTISPECIES: hypothetical protein [unclassified Oceanispirochaeta]MBF9016389.1 hypothetical protein [Oceanispirochaeta sp. M2]NPD72851.1 hypothetical protein [Oceanispirochaeta sp. M1]RDG31695.1 hypothetical protein DV872_12135 [Oceanispirochaeta sp. M1]